MKIKSGKWQVTSDKRRSPGQSENFAAHHSSLVTRHSKRGIALVITLILLSVTLVMALAFLAISRRESSSVATTGDTTAARLAADAALANAEAQAMSTILSTTNPYNFGLLVSTNYINPNGFNPAVTTYDPTNVNYVYANGNPVWVNPSDFVLLQGNLLYSPRPPVFVTTNSSAPLDFRFYLDLNRNGNYDGSFPMPATNGAGQEIVDVNNNPVIVTNTGDPEWIGVLEHPDAPHGPNNKFIARYAFIALPVGNGLDLNAIHNQVFDEANANLTINPAANIPNNTQDFFSRNQGVGSWEINLAAFLVDLNTNRWDNNLFSGIYQYNWPFNSPNVGTAFDDARALLAYRYNNNYGTLNSAANLFANGAAFGNDSIDGYSDGPLQTTPDTNADFFANNDNPALPWAGADNTNHFFTPSDLFDPNKTQIGVPPLQIGFGNTFTNRLTQAGSGVSTYDRYTFYRLLSQIGTDTAPEQGKLNINYMNVDNNGNIVPGMETNLIPWTNSLQFFTNAADRMLGKYTTEWFQRDPTNYLITYYGITPTYYVDSSGFGVTNVSAFGMTNQIPAFGVGNIPVYMNGRFVYTPAVQRVLQLAANIHDATTTNRFPSVFRPLLAAVNNFPYTNVFINGYVQQTNLIQSGEETNAAVTPDLVVPVEVTALPVGQDMLTNIYGVPWIIGAKKGLPNFNKFSLESAFGITRKVQFSADISTKPWGYSSNQMYFMGITNYYGVQYWNSYRSNYQGSVSIMTRLTMQMNITNDAGYQYNPYPNGVIVQSLAPIPTWRGSSFVLPFITNASFNFLYVSNGAAIYNYGNSTYPASQFIPQLTNQNNYLDKGTPPLPHFVLLMTNRLQLAIIDYSGGLNNGKIIDYVQLNGMDPTNDLNSEINFQNNDNDNDGLWNTNLPSDGNGMTLGVQNQITVSKNGNINGNAPTTGNGASGAWTTAQIPGLKTTSPEAESKYFSKFFGSSFSNSIVLTNPVVKTYPITYTSTNLQAPYTPSIFRVQRYTWQANDPLVHYLTSDLTDTENDANPQYVVDWPWNLGYLNERYMPWGFGSTNAGYNADIYNMALKDSMVTNSDSWDFPTNKFPTVGWLGRVHRGTPWQTVYLKATNLLDNIQVVNGVTNYVGRDAWQTWSGNTGNMYDATNAAPVKDRLLFDIFTTAFNANATRGQLSVNVAANNPDPAAGLAAWSAVFSGVVVPTNVVSSPPYVIQPAGTAGMNSTLGALVQAIYNTRTNTVLFPNKVFAHVGDILATPELTDRFQQLVGVTNTFSDEMYEWLPQQTMSLLRVGSPRYVVYSYGQALKPAPNGVWLNSSPAGTFGMVTNYQVVSETVTRSVVRIDSTVTNILGTNAVINNRAVIESFNVLPPD